MPPRRLTRAESAARTRARLLESAERVFFERGFHGASLEAVAEEAGLTKGAVYSRFESKADLFLAFQEERNRLSVERFARQFDDLGRGDRPTDLIVDYWRRKLLGDPPEYTLLVIEFWASACRDAEVQRRFSEQHDRILMAVAELLEQAAARLGVALALPALELSRLATAIAHGLALERLMNREKIDESMIEVAFAPIHQLSSFRWRAPRKASALDGSKTKGATHDGSSRRSARRRG